MAKVVQPVWVQHTGKDVRVEYNGKRYVFRDGRAVPLEPETFEAMRQIPGLKLVKVAPPTARMGVR